MQVLAEQKRDRPLRVCPQCGKEGYLYAKTSGKHRYQYTVHYNEPYIAIQPSGKFRYRECHSGGRLYNSIEDAEKAEQRERRKIRQKTIESKTIECPKCHKTGRLQDYTLLGVPHQVVVHEKVKGYWGKGKGHAKHKRCFLGKTQK